MKVVILAGGLGTRLSEETDVRPKPMVEIGGRPIIWHIMKIYSAYGVNDFIICCGYKQHVIKEFFGNILNGFNNLKNIFNLFLHLPSLFQIKVQEIMFVENNLSLGVHDTKLT